MRSEGSYQAPNSFTCTISGLLGGATIRRDDFVLIGYRAWLNTGSGMKEVDYFAPTVKQDVAMCPSTAVFWTKFADFSSFRVFPDRSEVVGGIATKHFAVDDALHAAAALGISMPNFNGVTINSYDIWIAERGNWPVAMQMDFSGDTRALSSALGFSGEAPAGQGRVTLHFAITQPNDSHIDIQPPVPPSL